MSDLKTTVHKNYLADAKSSISAGGRYWFFEMRPSANMLVSILRDNGYDVVLQEQGPDWEHVVSLTSNSVEETAKIANDRAAQRAKGVPEANLPR